MLHHFTDRRFLSAKMFFTFSLQVCWLLEDLSELFSIVVAFWSWHWIIQSLFRLLLDPVREQLRLLHRNWLLIDLRFFRL